MWIAITSVPGSSPPSNAGKCFRMRSGADITPQFVEMAQPSGFNPTATRPSTVAYGNRLYMVGVGTDNVLVDENFRIVRQGIRAPVLVPNVAVAAGPGRTGTCTIRIDIWDEQTDESSPLSAPSDPVDLVNQKVTITNLPTGTDDGRGTHVRVWVSMDGSAYRLATKRQLGVVSITEGVATLALGDAEGPAFERLPRGAINAIYHDRQCVAGVFGAEDTLFVSAPFLPERWEQLSFRTRNGEPIVAIKDAGSADVLLVLTPRSAYVLRGYTEDDMELKRRDEDIGAICHAGLCVINGCVVVPTDKTVFWFNGAFHNILRDRQTEWQEAYQAFPAVFEAGFAVHDPNDTTYTFFTPGFSSAQIPNPSSVSIGTVGWQMDYSRVLPELSGTMGQPDWTFLVMSRTVVSAVLLSLPGAKRGDVYLGFTDGKVRVKDADDIDDDGDDYQKRWWIRTGHYLFSDPGGDLLEGKTYQWLCTYAMFELNAWLLYAKGGDEQAYRQIAPNNTTYPWKDNVAASLLTISDVTYLPKTVHTHSPQKLSGRGLTLEYTMTAPNGSEWYGFAGVYGPGPSTRLPETVSEK